MKKTILLTLAFLAGMFATDGAARRNDNKRRGFNILPALCAVFFAVIISDTAFAFNFERADGNECPGPGLPTLNQRSDDVDTLHFAVAHDEAKAIRMINDGANVNAKFHGSTPLHFAAGHPNRGDVILALVKAGANLKARDNCRNTPLAIALHLYGESTSTVRTLRSLLKKKGSK